VTAPNPSPCGRLALALMAAAVFVACGKGPVATPATGTGGSLPVTGNPLGEFPNVGGTCGLLQEDEVQTVTGFPLTDRSGLARHGASPDPNTRTLCVFADSNSDSVVFSVSAETGDGKHEYDAAVALMTLPQPLPDLGDAASWSGRGVIVRLEVLTGNRGIAFSVSLGGPEQTQLLDIARTLATKVIDHL
jgi:hypothetical protein